jgi:hypothetical protein
MCITYHFFLDSELLQRARQLEEFMAVGSAHALIDEVKHRLFVETSDI